MLAILTSFSWPGAIRFQVPGCVAYSEDLKSMDEYGVSGVAKSATCDTNFYFHSKETLKD
jgi:hypothetical protein